MDSELKYDLISEATKESRSHICISELGLPTTHGYLWKYHLHVARWIDIEDVNEKVEVMHLLASRPLVKTHLYLGFESPKLPKQRSLKNNRVGLLYSRNNKKD